MGVWYVYEGPVQRIAVDEKKLERSLVKLGLVVFGADEHGLWVDDTCGALADPLRGVERISALSERVRWLRERLETLRAQKDSAGRAAETSV